MRDAAATSVSFSCIGLEDHSDGVTQDVTNGSAGPHEQEEGRHPHACAQPHRARSRGTPVHTLRIHVATLLVPTARWSCIEGCDDPSGAFGKLSSSATSLLAGLRTSVEWVAGRGPQSYWEVTMSMERWTIARYGAVARSAAMRARISAKRLVPCRALHRA